MAPEQAQEYGIIDEVYAERSELLISESKGKSSKSSLGKVSRQGEAHPWPAAPGKAPRFHIDAASAARARSRSASSSQQGVRIRDECITLCQVIEEELLDSPKAANKPKAAKLPNPRQIKESLDAYVIGQECAKRRSRWRL